MFITDIQNQSNQRARQLTTFHNLFPFIAGHSLAEMSVRYQFPFIVDWQLTEKEDDKSIESKMESPQVQ